MVCVYASDRQLWILSIHSCALVLSWAQKLYTRLVVLSWGGKEKDSFSLSSYLIQTFEEISGFFCCSGGTHIEEGFLVDVLRRSDGGCSWDHRLNLSQLNHTFTLLVLPALIISQLKTHTHTLSFWIKLSLISNSCNIWTHALTWCLVLSKTNNRGFHGFNKAPFLKRIPSKLLMGKMNNPLQYLRRNHRFSRQPESYLFSLSVLWNWL